MLSNLKYINTSKIIGLIFSLSFIFFDIGSSYSLIFFLLIMLTIGIPHGSIDHLIAFINPNARKFKNKLHFFIIYLPFGLKYRTTTNKNVVSDLN